MNALHSFTESWRCSSTFTLSFAVIIDFNGLIEREHSAHFEISHWRFGNRKLCRSILSKTCPLKSSPLCLPHIVVNRQILSLLKRGKHMKGENREGYLLLLFPYQHAWWLITSNLIKFNHQRNWARKIRRWKEPKTWGKIKMSWLHFKPYCQSSGGNDNTFFCCKSRNYPINRPSEKQISVFGYSEKLGGKPSEDYFWNCWKLRTWSPKRP